MASTAKVRCCFSGRLKSTSSCSSRRPSSFQLPLQDRRMSFSGCRLKGLCAASNWPKAGCAGFGESSCGHFFLITPDHHSAPNPISVSSSRPALSITNWIFRVTSAPPAGSISIFSPAHLNVAVKSWLMLLNLGRGTFWGTFQSLALVATLETRRGCLRLLTLQDSFNPRLTFAGPSISRPLVNIRLLSLGRLADALGAARDAEARIPICSLIDFGSATLNFL
ncbi:hypothetical protein Salat_0926300 [Sesamum alatum]|uniref:Uncharacterized protein n=1 Tax=Sesamum alatum TaxID=300844 RepID=A0AAE2CRC4_9LAMI|nr:hypothetical protein Salat_0926300 [Sesamum alatum]